MAERLETKKRVGMEMKIHSIQGLISKSVFLFSFFVLIILLFCWSVLFVVVTIGDLRYVKWASLEHFFLWTFNFL